MAYPVPIPLDYTLQLSFRITPATLQQISLLAFIGQTGYHDDKSDHLAVSFIQGYIMLTWNLGGGPRRIFTQKAVEWDTEGGQENTYLIEVGRVGRAAWLSVDGKVNISGNAPGGISKFEVVPMLYLGGHEVANFSTLPHDLPLHSGFQGCIYDLQLISGNINIPLLETRGMKGRGVGQCGTRECHRHACQHDGACLQHGATFTCICQEGWHGPFCAQPRSPCAAENNRCAAEAFCMPLVNSYECDCPVGRTGKYCTSFVKHISDVSLTGRRSYLAVKWPQPDGTIAPTSVQKREAPRGETLRDLIEAELLYPSPIATRFIIPTHAAQSSRVQQFSVEFQIRPLSERGLLMFFGGLESNAEEEAGFVSLSLQGGMVEYRMATGRGQVSVVRSTRILAIGEWHKIKVIQNGRRMTLWVEGSSSTTMAPNLASFITAHTLIYVGGLPDLARLPHAAVSTYPMPFRGCFRQLSVSGVRIPLNESTIESARNIQDCDGTACGGDSCDAGGHCWLDERLKPHCKCPETAKGERCELPVSCHVVSCKNGGECLRHGACSCPNGWGGYFCEIAINRHSAPSFGGASYLVVPPPRIPTKEKRNGPKLTSVARVSRQSAAVSVNFSTINPNQMILWSGESERSFLGLGLVNGHVRIASSALQTRNRSIDVPAAGFIADGGWHNVKIVVESNSLAVLVDGREAFSEVISADLTGIGNSPPMETKFYIGGFPHNVSIANQTFNLFSRPFTGCLDDINFGNEFIAQMEDFALFEGKNIGECELFDDYVND